MNATIGEQNTAHTVVIIWKSETKEIIFFSLYQESEVEEAKKTLAKFLEEDTSQYHFQIGLASNILQTMLTQSLLWEKLDNELSDFYEEGSDADLCDIGEAAATAFGYL